MRFAGAALLLVSCGGIGAAKVRSLRVVIRNTAELLRALDRMETEICIRRRTLPEAAALLETECPRCFSGLGDIDSMLRDKPFSVVWNDHFLALELSDQAKSAVCTLGEDLSSGARPETAFSACRRQLQATEDVMKKTLERNGKVYIAAGLAAGCLLVIAAA